MGTRLRPLTAYVPKALIPIGGKFLIDHILDYLDRHGIRDIIILSSSDDHAPISNHLSSRNTAGTKITYDVRDRIGTAGALGAASKQLSETFIIYYGDVLVDFDLNEAVVFHKTHKAALTIVLSKSTPIDYGVAQLSPNGRVIYFKEKPVLPEYPISVGIYIAEPAILPYCKPKTDLSYDVIPTLLRENVPVYGFVTDRRHYDIGTFKSLEEVRDLFEQQR
jgi:mannose-1-phosphate guanylyltransferase/phosphomannomutase